MNLSLKTKKGDAPRLPRTECSLRHVKTLGALTLLAP